VDAPVEGEPEPGDEEAIHLLDDAEAIVNSVASETLAEVERDEQRSQRRGVGTSNLAAGRAPRRRRWPWQKG
jgi:hypothetical protein